MEIKERENFAENLLKEIEKEQKEERGIFFNFDVFYPDIYKQKQAERNISLICKKMKGSNN